jgi:hypothetical protein
MKRMGANSARTCRPQSSCAWGRFLLHAIPSRADEILVLRPVHGAGRPLWTSLPSPALGRWVADLSDGWVTCAAPSLASPPAGGVALLAEQTTGAGIAHPAGILSQPLAPACAAAGTRTHCPPAAALNLSPSWRERPSRLFLLARLGGFLIGSEAAVSAAR